jgi:Fe-S cluster biogenesis protein NfuA
MKPTEAISVVFESTPNPQSLKFKVNKVICEESYEFNDVSSAQQSPLAAKLFGFPWTEGVFLGQDFITITKQNWVDWETLAEPLTDLITEHLQKGGAIILPTSPLASASDIDDGDDPVVQRIKNILYNEVRPAVAMDGGDISFHSYVDEIVYVYMRGACSGCPSSSMTLKMGIESRLKEAIPEIKEVVAL